MHKKKIKQNPTAKEVIKNLIVTPNCWRLTENFDLMILYDVKLKKYRAFCNDMMCRFSYPTPELAKKRCYGMAFGDIELKKLSII